MAFLESAPHWIHTKSMQWRASEFMYVCASASASVRVPVSVNRCYASNFVELCNRIQMKYLNVALHIFSHAYISIYWLVYFYNYYHFCLLAREARDFYIPPSISLLFSAIRSSHSASVFTLSIAIHIDCVLIFVLCFLFSFCGLL